MKIQSIRTCMQDIMAKTSVIQKCNLLLSLGLLLMTGIDSSLAGKSL